ncbi:hypothetical protein JTB14_016160 [Gonioctena quinquepunctata]|nr:hypothetical protein JTB14_016160 [Gonioctena quinquepunctata]
MTRKNSKDNKEKAEKDSSCDDESSYLPPQYPSNDKQIKEKIRNFGIPTQDKISAGSSDIDTCGECKFKIKMNQTAIECNITSSVMSRKPSKTKYLCSRYFNPSFQYFQRVPSDAVPGV